MLKKGQWWTYRDSGHGVSPCKIADPEIHDNFVKAKFGLFCFWITKKIRQDDLKCRTTKPWWCWF